MSAKAFGDAVFGLLATARQGPESTLFSLMTG